MREGEISAGVAAKPVLLAARSISKSFGGVRALDDVDLEIRGGEVHAIVGENGAGKSTLTKILSGVLSPDVGVVAVAGVPTPLSSPAHARQLGIVVVHQELELADSLSIAENVFLGRLPGSRGFVSRRGLIERSRAALSPFGFEIDPSVKVRRLSIAARQIVEIAKATIGEARVLFFDEPTAALSPAEADRVHRRVRLLRDQGSAIVYVSHNLDDVLAIADRISVLRDGRKVAELRPRETSRPALIEQILGHELDEIRTRDHTASSDIALSCHGLSVPPQLGSVSFHARCGEVVGFFGLVGAGQGTIAEALFGLHPGARGDVEGKTLKRLPACPREAIAGGLGYVPPDRKNQGLALGMSLEDNILLTCREKASRFGFVDRRRTAALAGQIAESLDIRHAGLGQRARHLSGGNQQKIVLGKWQAKGVPIMLLNQPTRGVDVGARAEIYRLLRRDAARGGASLVFSSDAEEIDLACDRAYVLQKGAITAELVGADLSVPRLLRAAL